MTVTFRRPFVLGLLDEVLPAGVYQVEIEEQLLEGVSFPVYRRMSAQIDLPPDRRHPGRTQTLIIDPKDLEAALQSDHATTEESAFP